MKQVFQGVLNERLVWKESAAHTLVVQAHSKGELYVRIEGEALELTLDLLVMEGSEVSVWLDVRTRTSLQLQQQIRCEQQASVHVSILDLADGVSEHSLVGEHLGREARIEVHTATLGSADKHWRMELIHQHPHTYAFMENYCVVEDAIKLDVEAIGNIKKGAYGSESHQKTRVLTMSERHNAQVVPVLYIDENDVKASHAMTLGQPDEEQLYYLQTRGITREMALGLLSIGYFLPIIERISNSELREEIRCSVEEKVGLYGRQSHS